MLSVITCNILVFFLALVAFLPTVSAKPDIQPFPDITFKFFSDFVAQNFSSCISLATVLLVLFSLTENPDLLNLHSRQQNPFVQGERKQTTSGWIKTLTRALQERIGDKSRTLLKQKEIPPNSDNNSLITPIASKLDGMADILRLKPIYSKEGKLKHKLRTISHQEIAAVHIICPASVECQDKACSPVALLQDSRFWDIPRVTLIKGTTIYKNVFVLYAKCAHCNTIYYADHEAINQVSSKRNKIFLNSAKYLKVGQSIWVNRSFSNSVVNGIYSFHASASAYAEYWNNTFGQVDLNHSAKLDRRHIWQAFVQESIRTIAADQKVHLELKENLPINDVTKEAFNALGGNGVINAAKGHECPECTQPYRLSANSEEDTMDIDHADVTMHVVDGIVMGPTYCAYPNCESDLQNARGGSFCAVHEQVYGNRCRFVGCENDRAPSIQACIMHKREWERHTSSRRVFTCYAVLPY